VKNRVLSLLLAVTLTLSVGLISCGGEDVPEYNLTISSTEGGSVTSPGESGPYTYDEGEVVSLVAKAEEGYEFVNWTGDVDEIADVEDNTTTITMKGDYSITAKFAVKQYSLIVESTEGGSVTTPGENAYTYEKGEVVNLTAVPDEGYQFINWTGDVDTIADVDAASTTITMNGGYSITANFAGEICDWYDLDAIRDNLDGSYILVNDLDSSNAGYEDLASTTANGGKGWDPIGYLLIDPFYFGFVDNIPFTGVLDGRGYEIRDLFIDRPDEDGVALVSIVDGQGMIQNLGVTDAEVVGHGHSGSLAGHNLGTISNSYSSASVRGDSYVGGLIGGNSGTVTNSYSTGKATGEGAVGGLAGGNWHTVSDSYSACDVISTGSAGGLVGWQHHGSVSNSYFNGSVTGQIVGGLVAENNDSNMSNSYYSYDEVFINGKNVITIGALWDDEFEQWLDNDKCLDINERLSQEDGYYLINDVTDFKQLLVFGQDDTLKFTLTADLDLGGDSNFYIPYLAGEFDGSDNKIRNLTFSFDFVSQIGLFGYVVSGAKVSEVGVEDVYMTGHDSVGALVGRNEGTISNSYAAGRVAGEDRLGGLVGENDNGTVSNSHYNYDEVLINGKNMVSAGALSGEDFEQWLANDKFLDINERLAREDGYYLIEDVSDFKSLLAFGDDNSLKFSLRSDLNLGTASNFYIPYLAGEFDGNGYKMRNLTFDCGFVSEVGLFGYLASSGKVSELGVENVNITGCHWVGALVGQNAGTVSDSYSTGSMTGVNEVGGLLGGNTRDGAVNNSYSIGSVSGGVSVGGLVGNNEGSVTSSYSTGGVSGGGGIGGVVGENGGTVINCYFTGNVIGEWGIGGLVGTNGGTVDTSYSAGTVTGMSDAWAVGGLVGQNREGSLSNSFWNIETSEEVMSDDGMGKTTAEMKSIATFSGAGWNIIAVVDPSTRNPSYIWNIVDGQTYPFLSWQS
jgi:hypothetical protein